MQKVWDVPNSGFLRKKWVAYAGERWRGFKTNLTSKYIHGDLRDRSPLEIYNFLDEETWQAFVQIRLDPSFQVSWIYNLVGQPNLFLVLNLIRMYAYRRLERERK
jgi:hypothetical protein